MNITDVISLHNLLQPSLIIKNDVIYLLDESKDELYDTVNYICKDFERFKIIVKKLSLIILYFSRCDKFNTSFKKQVKAFKDVVNEKIKECKQMKRTNNK